MSLQRQPRRRHAPARRHRRKLFRWGIFAIGICAVVQVGMHSAVTQHQRTLLLSEQSRLGHSTSLEELSDRSNRFPSVEERVKLYMSSWYLPPCSAKDQIVFSIHRDDEYFVQWNGSDDTEMMVALSRQPENSKRLFRYDTDTMELCRRASERNRFCDDALQYYAPSLERLSGSQTVSRDINPPLILQFGDAEEWNLEIGPNRTKVNYPMLPVLKKFRYAVDTGTIDRLTANGGPSKSGCRRRKERLAQAVRGPLHTQAIITIVTNVHRHFGPLETVPKFDIPWDRKWNKAVYRGGLTGRNHRITHHDASHTKPSSRQECQDIPRCNFVLEHAGSEMVDAKLVEIKSGKDLDLHTIDGIQIFGETLSMEQMLQYKAIVMLEGNDVSTGLKWALFSNSVVVMQRPTCTSWVMEELLEPFVHYVPIDEKHNVEEAVQWIVDNDSEAQAIARRGQMWMKDLLFHPEADKETELILDETFRRYMAHFRIAP